MTLPATGSYEALWGTLTYLFQTEVAGPIGLTVRSPNNDRDVNHETVWAETTFEITERGQPRRCNPGHPQRLGTQVRASFNVTLLVREEPTDGGSIDTRRSAELADAIRSPWPTGCVLPIYDTRSETVSTVIHGFVHVMDRRSQALEPLGDGVRRHRVQFDLSYLEESE